VDQEEAESLDSETAFEAGGKTRSSHILTSRYLFLCTERTQSLADLDWDWKNERVVAPMDKGRNRFSCSSLILTLLATHIIFPGESEEVEVDSRPLGLVPQHEVDAIVAKLKGHKHLFEANAVQDSSCLHVIGPGDRDFCNLYRVKVPVSIPLV
jgi:hypothetical protein